ncbi:MAG: signal recognition particle-docking protein FtsY [Ferrovibrio sp.]|uniref:signal recognition particle-docking protein FtsY n=1 Tax=Ferrovibrio sp. TaxID=1917215 RepID=UPI002619BFC4|nr:signal recognition particle-docking protein FtsY [Ferrovibrio sp.]MCW0235909.1 signal recognition particle-docking protein FtsY [Ferrovibrio sp.]
MSDTEAEKKTGWFGRLKAGLSRSAGQLGEQIGALFTKRKLDREALDELEETLIRADLGIATAGKIVAAIARDRFEKDISAEEIRIALAESVTPLLQPVEQPMDLTGAKPQVILVVGVNGVGKTTTIGKIASKLRDDGKRVMLVAGDTFRAAAVEQLKVWGERARAPVLARETGADAAGLAFDALTQAQADGIDVLMIDTAGRLQNKADLMAELAKIVRVLKKQVPDAPHHVLLVLDATTGQNAISQVATFKEICAVSGLVVTKLDGTARGGVLVAIADKFGLPVHYIGVGEQAADLQPFSARGFARALAGLDQ